MRPVRSDGRPGCAIFHGGISGGETVMAREKRTKAELVDLFGKSMSGCRITVRRQTANDIDANWTADIEDAVTGSIPISFQADAFAQQLRKLQAKYDLAD